MLKFIFIFMLIVIFVLIAVIIAVIIALKKEYDVAIDNSLMYQSDYLSLQKRFQKLEKEKEIEKKHNEELAKKLADISHMSIADVLNQLQND